MNPGKLVKYRCVNSDTCGVLHIFLKSELTGSGPRKCAFCRSDLIPVCQFCNLIECACEE